MPNNKIIILFGRSGCGKGTQAELLIKEFGFEYISSGDLIRQRKEKKDFTGKQMEKILARGDRVPTAVFYRIWSQRIAQLKKKIDNQGLVVDGSPRSLIEAKLMDELFSWYRWEQVYPVLLEISHQEAFDRLTKRRICQKCGHLIPWLGHFKDLKVCDQCGGELVNRPDDKPEAIKARLTYYQKDVEPVVEDYQNQARLIRVNGEQSIEDVYQELKKALNF